MWKFKFLLFGIIIAIQVKANDVKFLKGNIISVDNSTPVILNPEISTSFNYNEKEKETTEIFEKPKNLPVIIKHRVKYFPDYIREIWHIYNPDNKKHKYRLILALWGIGDSVYIPGYGTLNTQKKINILAKYIVFYSSEKKENDGIYVFSEKINLIDAKKFKNIAMQISGVFEITLPQQTSIFFSSYFSNKIKKKEKNFEKIYSDFAKKIIGNGDTLTQIFPEEKINSYKIGQNICINLKLKNNGILKEEREFDFKITQPGPWGSEFSVYNLRKKVIIPANKEITLPFRYKIPKNFYGQHRVLISNGIEEISTIFFVSSPFEVKFEIPENVKQKERFYVKVTIRNALEREIKKIKVKIKLPNDFSTNDSLIKKIDRLLPGESKKLSWYVEATDFEYGYAPFTIYIDSEDGIKDIKQTYTNVLKLPELTIYPSSPEKVKMNVPFILKVRIENEGDLKINNVSIKISLPEGVKTPDNLIKSIGDIEGGKSKIVEWKIIPEREDGFWINLSANDGSKKYSADSTIFIKVEKTKRRYAVIVPYGLEKDKKWKEVVLKLKKKYSAKVFRYKDLSEIKNKVAGYHPYYVCFVQKPDCCSREFVKNVIRFMEKLDSDPYDDGVWAILTGYTADDALKIVEAEPLKVKRHLSHIGGGWLEWFREGVSFCEIRKYHKTIKRKGEKPEVVKGPGDTTEEWVREVNSNKVDIISTSGHAREYVWEMGYGYKSGRVVPAGGGKLKAISSKGKVYLIKTSNPKIYYSPGNCLIANIPKNFLDCLCLSWIHNGCYNFFGHIDSQRKWCTAWGIAEYFFKLQDTYTFAEAVHVNRISARYVADNYKNGFEKSSWYRCLHITVLYGDPGWEAKMERVRPPLYGFKFDVKDLEGKKKGILAVKFNYDCKINHRNLPVFLLPYQIYDWEIKKSNNKVVIGDDFVLFDVLNKEFKKGDELKVEFNFRIKGG